MLSEINVVAPWQKTKDHIHLHLRGQSLDIHPGEHNTTLLIFGDYETLKTGYPSSFQVVADSHFTVHAFGSDWRWDGEI